VRYLKADIPVQNQGFMPSIFMKKKKLNWKLELSFFSLVSYTSIIKRNLGEGVSEICSRKRLAAKGGRPLINLRNVG